MRLLPEHVSHAVQGRAADTRVRRNVAHVFYAVAGDSPPLEEALREGRVSRLAQFTLDGGLHSLVRILQPVEIEFGVRRLIAARDKGLYLLNASGPVFRSGD